MAGTHCCHGVGSLDAGPTKMHHCRFLNKQITQCMNEWTNRVLCLGQHKVILGVVACKALQPTLHTNIRYWMISFTICSLYLNYRLHTDKGLLPTPFNRFFKISTNSTTQGHSAKITKAHCQLDTRRFFSFPKELSTEGTNWTKKLLTPAL